MADPYTLLKPEYKAPEKKKIDFGGRPDSTNVEDRGRFDLSPWEKEQSRAYRESVDAFRGPIFDRNEIFEPRVQRDPGIDITNILFGEEMHALGFALDEQGFHHDFSTAKDAWADHPIMSSIAIASIAFPIGGKIAKGLRAFKLKGITDDVLKGFGLIENSVDFSKMPEKFQNMVRIQAYDLHKAKELESKFLGNRLNQWEKIQYSFRKWAGNTYTDMVDAGKGLNARAAYIDRMQNVLKGREIQTFLDDLPAPKYGGFIARYMHDGNIRHLDGLPEDVQQWARRFAEEAEDTQKLALAEGLITEETLERVGPRYVSMIREASRRGMEEGPTVTKHTLRRGKRGVETIHLPRTESPMLAYRKAEFEEVGRHLRHQQTLDFLNEGKTRKALKNLDPKEDAEIIAALRAGDHNTAVAKMSELGEINLTPEALTTHSMIQQKLLLENYRYLRDIAMNPDVVFDAAKVRGMSAAAKKGFIDLDSLGGKTAATLRRMIAKSKKISPEEVGELGYVRKELFDELMDFTTGQPAQRGVFTGMLEFLTALHKTAKTALNPFTHGQNFAGNVAFMAWAGVPIHNPKTWGTMRDSWNAVRTFQKAKRANKLDEVKSLGKLKSEVGGPDIDFMEEMLSGEARQLIEESSMVSQEGLGVMERMVNNADRSQEAMNWLLTSTQWGSERGRKWGISIADWADRYMAEDGLFKLGYFMHLRANGMTRAASALEVAKRMPMYNTIGRGPRHARKVILPWISFPAEAWRIAKNNTIDYPLRMAMWYQGCDMLQATMYPFSSESADSIHERVKGLPMWAQKPLTTVMTPIKDRNDDHRALITDFIPYSSFLPQTVAKEAPMLQKAPFGMQNPAPILMGLVQALQGKDQWGRDMPVESDWQRFGVAVTNTVGFLMPPMVQKYLLNPAQPSGTYRLRQELGQYVNPATGKPGEPFFDVFMNNLSPIGKMYPSSPEQRLANERMYNNEIRAHRARLWKNFGAFARSGDPSSVNETLQDLMESYRTEWRDPGVAHRKYYDGLIDHQRTLRQHPKLRPWTKEQMVQRLRTAREEGAKSRNKANRELQQTIRREISMR